MKKDFCFEFNEKKVKIDVRICDSLLSKFVGLMFKTKNTNALLFKFNRLTKQPIHSLFVFFPFVAIWLDNKNSVVDLKIVRPWKFHVKPKYGFSNLIEIPLNKKYQSIVKILVGGERFKY